MVMNEIQHEIRHSSPITSLKGFLNTSFLTFLPLAAPLPLATARTSDLALVTD